MRPNTTERVNWISPWSCHHSSLIPQDAIDDHNLHDLDGSQLLLHHGEDKITFAELPKNCRDWKLAKYQKEGKHFGQLFLHSPSQGAKPVWVFKLKFLDLPDEKETRLKEKMKQENAQGKVSEEKTDAQKIKDEVKAAEEKKALEEDKERKASEAEAAAKEKALKEANDEKQRKAAEAEVAAQKKAMEDEVRAQVEQKLRDEIRQQMEEEVKAKMQKEVDAAAAMNSKKSEDENEELKQTQEKQKEELEKKREEEELEKKKREEEELMLKQSQEKEMQEIERKKREEEEEKKRQAAIIQANKESALKRKGAAKEEPEPRSAKKVKVPTWGHFGQGVGKVCSFVCGVQQFTSKWMSKGFLHFHFIFMTRIALNCNYYIHICFVWLSFSQWHSLSLKVPYFFSQHFTKCF